ncbi:MAG: HAD family hydrolase [Candidatus Woesearchaeota archaeon]|nr:HAD family hydrolase [Candidatus Woesearchaeota archaeon]
MSVKAVVFDFWGTLVATGTYSPMRQTHRLLAPQHEFSEFVQIFETAFMTKEYRDQAEAFSVCCEAFGMPPRNYMISRLIGIWNKNKILAQLFPDTVETLDALKKKGIKIGVVSNTDCFGMDMLFDRLEIKNFIDVVHFSFRTGILKNDSSAVDAMLQELGVSKDETLMVGDSVESDMACAQAVGIKGILVDRKNKREFSPKIVDLRELVKLLEE